MERNIFVNKKKGEDEVISFKMVIIHGENKEVNTCYNTKMSHFEEEAIFMHERAINILMKLFKIIWNLCFTNKCRDKLSLRKN